MKVGDKVRHAVYGIGVVENISGMGLTSEITVRFDQHGIKRLTQAWAPLQVIHQENQTTPTAGKPTPFTGGSKLLDGLSMRQTSPKGNIKKSFAEQISVLFELYKHGRLTADEFSAAKAKILELDD